MIEPATLTSASAGVSGRRLSRLIWVFVLAVIAIALGTTAVPWTLSTNALRNEVAAQIRQATGLETLSQGRSVFAILPQPHIKIDQISFGDPGSSLHVDAEYFKGYLRILPLFVGRLEIASATLLKPSLIIDLDANPLVQNSAIGRAAGAKPESMEAAAADTARLGTVSLVNGTARLKMKSAPSDIVIDDIDMTLDWRNLNAPASLTGKARVRGEFGDVSAWIAEPAELLRGGRSEMSLDIKTDVLTLTTNGTLSGAAKPEFSGHLQAASPALPKLLELIGYPIARTSAFSQFRLVSETKANAGGISFSKLSLRLAGSDYEGSLAIETGEPRPLFSGTLATDLLALDPFFAHFKPMIGDDRQWNREPLDFRALTEANLDIRVSAARARLGRFEIQDAALSLLTQASRIDLSLTEAKAYHGLIKARGTLNLGKDSIDLRAASSIAGLDAGTLSWDTAGLPELTGSASGTANIETAGQNLSDFIQHLTGRIQLNAKQGDVRGIDLDRMMRSQGEGASIQAADALSVRVPYDQAQLGIKIVNGMAEVEQGLADGPGGHVLLSGIASLPGRTFDLRAAVLPIASTEAIVKAAQDRNIVIKGPWDHPLIAPVP